MWKAHESRAPRRQQKKKRYRVRKKLNLVKDVTLAVKKVILPDSADQKMVNKNYSSGPSTYRGRRSRSSSNDRPKKRRYRS